MNDTIRRRRLMLTALIGALALLMLMSQPAAQAAQRPIDPREVGLTPADLPPGFSVDPATTGVSLLPDSAGVMYRVDMKRPRTAETLADGPIIVLQTIVRLDGDVPGDAMLAELRDELVREVQMSPTTEGPNDGGTISLKRTDGEFTMYAVGFVKQPMVIVTVWGGAAPVTTFPKLIELAGVSSARLDQALNR